MDNSVHLLIDSSGSRNQTIATRTRGQKPPTLAILGTNDGHQNGKDEDSANMRTESHDDSSLIGKRPARNGRKRGRAQTSQVTVSEHGGNDSEEQSESVMTGQRKKRREKVPPAEQPPKERRYNLRRPKV